MSKCQECGSDEVDANTPRTVYSCGSSDYDQRPGTFIQGPGCKKKRFCEWFHSSEGEGIWGTKCQQMHIFIDGGPVENSYVFCPYCGKKIEEVKNEN